MVTGCARPNGLGASFVRAFAAAGAAVVLVDRPGPEVTAGLDALAREAGEHQTEAMVRIADVSDPSSVSAAVEAATDRHGRLDILVNNAAADLGSDRVPIDELKIEDWDRQLAVNLRGAFLCTRAVIPHMRTTEYGRIVNVSSVLGTVGHPGRAAYGSTKTALIGFTRSVALDVASDGITVNAVCPGLVVTDRQLASARLASNDVDAELVRRGAAVPVGRLGAPEDVAAVVSFLVSGPAAYLTGQAIVVDGGLTAKMATA